MEELQMSERMDIQMTSLHCVSTQQVAPDAESCNQETKIISTYMWPPIIVYTSVLSPQLFHIQTKYTLCEWDMTQYYICIQKWQKTASLIKHAETEN